MNPNHQPTTDEQAMQHILSTPRTVAVVGLSPKPHRDSFKVSRYMQAHGWRVVPVNPVVAASGEHILGETVYASLTEAAKAEVIEVVNVFRNSIDVPPIVDEAMALGLPAIWLQLGVVHPAAVNKARAAGLQVVQDCCLMVAHARHAPQRG